MDDKLQDDILIEVDPSGPRRWVGIIMLWALSGLLLYLAFAHPPANALWLVFLIALGLFCLWVAYRLQVATMRKLYLTEDALIDSDGQVLTRIEDVVSVDRGMLAIKPSNGFMLKLKNPGPRAWQPGLWWRIGRRLAVGGVTNSGQTRPMADIISIKIAQKD